MHDLLEKCLFLFMAAKELKTTTVIGEARKKVINLSDLISQGLQNLRTSLPGFKEIDLAVNTINSAISELSYDLPTGVGI